MFLAMDTGEALTLGAAILGAVTGPIALVQQWVLFSHSGPRIEAHLRWAWVNAIGSGAISAAMSRPLTGPPEPGFDRLMLAVEVRNKGRAATTIEKVQGVLTDGTTFTHVTPPAGPRQGLRLDAETSETWYLDMEPLAVAAKVMETEPVVRGVVILGSGREVKTRETARLPSPGHG